MVSARSVLSGYGYWVWGLVAVGLLRLTLERRRRGWTARLLARRSGVHFTTISSIESGRIVPSAAERARIGAELGVPPERLLDPVDDPEDPS